MKKSNAYDLPVRIFHWVFALLFVMSFSIAKWIDDDSKLYAYHMLSGILMVFIVILRILWGFLGSKTSRFSSFKLKPLDLASYLSSVVSSRSRRYLGHNPASSYAAVLMILFTLGIGMSGLMMTLRMNKHFFEEVHELLAHGFLVTVIFHIIGVLLHQMKHNDGMAFSMINGKKDHIDTESEIRSNHSLIAVFFIVMTTTMTLYLTSHFDSNQGKLTILGKSFQLGEDEHNDNHGKGLEYWKDEDEDDD